MVEYGSVTIRINNRWRGAGVGLGLAVSILGGLLVRAGLADADRWASVLGLFLNIAGLAVTLTSVIQGRRSSISNTEKITNTIRNSEVDGTVVIGRDLARISLAGAPILGSSPAGGRARSSGNVENTVDGGRFHGPLIMARDVDDGALPPSGNNQPGRNGAER